jgi:hypothetical protein
MPVLAVSDIHAKAAALRAVWEAEEPDAVVASGTSSIAGRHLTPEIVRSLARILRTGGRA